MPHPQKRPRAPIPSSLVERAKVKLDSALASFSFVDDPRETQLYLRGGDSPMAKGERVDLIQRLHAGEFIELEMAATVFIQRDTPNYNFLRFRPGDMAGLAKSYTGTPFLRNHGTDQQGDRGGTIVSSKLVHNDDGSKQFDQRLHLVKPWAVESALDGTLDRFSIGWYRGGTSECSICKASWLSCMHWPGELDADAGVVCELIQVSPRGKETSYVNAPAVLGTSPASISQLEALDPALLADILAADTTPGDDDDMKILTTLIAALALPATSTEDDVLSAVTTQRDELTAMRDRATIAEAGAQGVKDRLAVIEIENAKRATVDRLTVVEAGIASLIAAGKIKPGSETELALKRQGGVSTKPNAAGVLEVVVDLKRDVDVFSASVKDLLASGPVVTPVGAVLPMVLPDPLPATPTDAKAFLAAAPETASWLARAGIKPEDFEKHGAAGRALVVGKFGG